MQANSPWLTRHSSQSQSRSSALTDSVGELGAQQVLPKEAVVYAA